jgi:hypothetical protein
MTGRHHQAFRLLASTVTAAALAVPATAAAGGNAGAKGSANDSNRPGITAAGTALANATHSAYPVQVANPILQNDIRHFGNPVVVRVEGGFDWTAAGVGAAGGVGLALVVGAGTFGLRRRQRLEAARA